MLLLSLEEKHKYSSEVKNIFNLTYINYIFITMYFTALKYY